MLFQPWIQAQEISSMWTEVQKLEESDQYNAAQQMVLKIYENAVAQQNQEEWQKALIRMVALERGLHGYETAVKILWEKQWPTQVLQKSILHLFLANTLFDYYNSYSWEINQREKINDPDNKTLKQWTAFEIFEEINKQYSIAYQNKELLSRRYVHEFSTYIQRNGYPQHIFATLRDFSVTQWVDFLANTVTWTPIQLKEKHLLNLEMLSSDPEARTRMEDNYFCDVTTHPLQRLVYLLDELYYWNKTQNQMESMLETQLLRFRILKTHFTTQENKKLLQDRLQAMLPKYQTYPWWAAGQYELAQIVQDQDDLVLAHDIAKFAFEKYPDSPGGQKCKQLYTSIEEPNFSVQTMSLDGLNVPSLTIRYKNIDMLYFRAYKVDFESFFMRKKRYIGSIYNEDLRNILQQQTPDYIWSERVENLGDYQFHRAKSTPKIAQQGFYVIAASYRQDFAIENDMNYIMGTTFLVTDYVTLINQVESGWEIFVMDGKKGEAVPNAQVSLYRYEYNRAPLLVHTYYTNQKGTVLISNASSIQRDFVLVRHNGQVSYDTNSLYSYRRNPEQETKGCFIYTDRSIYRPTQKIYYKVVTYSGNSKTGVYYTYANQDIVVHFFDYNNKLIASQTVQANAYGTVSGEFEIPTGRALGRYRIEASCTPKQNIFENILERLTTSRKIYGNAYVRVEEYKRPTFEVTLEKPEKPLKLNENVQVTGQARYYFGMPVSNAEVRYRVTREPIFPWWYWWFYDNQDAKNVYEVASGTIKITDEGKFIIPFVPKADPNVDKSVYYQFKVSAEVLDEGGETRSTEYNYPIGFVAVQANLNAEYNYFLPNEQINIEIKKTDLSSVPQNGEGYYQLVNLQIPTSVLTPDKLPLEPKKNRLSTPGDRLRDRWEPNKPLGQYLYFLKDNSIIQQGPVKHDNEGKAFAIFSNLAPGAYRVYYTTHDIYNNEYKTQKEFLVVDENIQLGVPFILLTRKAHVNVGEKAEIFFASGQQGQTAYYERYLDRKLEERIQHVQIKNQFLQIPIQEKHRGGFSLRLFSIMDYKFYDIFTQVYVPWDNKSLKISFSHFRDLLTPGQKEQWEVIVQSHDDKAVAAEVLAYMYDRSLDFFCSHNTPQFSNLFASKLGTSYLRSNLSYCTLNTLYSPLWNPYVHAPSWSLDSFKCFDNYPIGGLGQRRMYKSYMAAPSCEPEAMCDESVALESAPRRSAGKVAVKSQSMSNKGEMPVQDADKETGDSTSNVAMEPDTIRSDFRETAFFQPHLTTDDQGRVYIQFTAPESVTSWNLYVHAMTKDLCFMTSKKEVVTRKSLMVRPYVPRFLREGDRADLKVVINNASDQLLQGQATIKIIDPETKQDRSSDFQLTNHTQIWQASAKKSTNLTWTLYAPRNIHLYSIQVTASTNEFKDGELRPLPVLPSRIHLAQSKFAILKENQTKTMTLPDLAKSAQDPTLLHQQLVITTDAQLIYSVLNALPYLYNYPYESVDTILYRFIAAAITSSIYEQYPDIAKIAQKMSKRQTQYLEWNQEDPNRKLTLEETPWLFEAKGGEDDMSKLFNMLNPTVAETTRTTSLKKLQEMQYGDGSFPWWAGGDGSPFMTLTVLYGFAKAQEFQVQIPKEMIQKAWKYLVSEYKLRYEIDLKNNKLLSYHFVTFLNYTLSCYQPEYYQDTFTLQQRQEMLEYSFSNWRKLSPYLKAYLAMTLHRMYRPQDAQLVLASIMDSAITTEDQGTHWAREDRSWLWYNDNIESHAQILRTLQEVTPNNTEHTDGLILWLLLNKKFNQWKSTKATAEVLYSLLYVMKKQDALAKQETATITIADKQHHYIFEPDNYTGNHNQIVFSSHEVTPEMATVKAQKTGPGYLFTSMTWHFSTEQMPSTPYGDYLYITRQYYKRVPENNAYTLIPVTANTQLQVGDQMEVHISIRAKHAMEYVHLQDPRPAALEPETQKSQHKYNLGIRWYEEVKDTATNFFFENLPQGEYNFKYRLRVNMAGNFQASPATIQSLYAPEFVAYSQALRLQIKN